MKKGNSLIIVLLAVFGLILIFELLVAFKVISLSSFPKFLPPKNITSVINPSPSSSPLPVKISCPIPISPCEGKDMLRNGAYFGIGFTVKNSSPILAAISGNLLLKDKDSTKSGIFAMPDDAYLYGKGEAKGYTAIYDFVGDKLGKEFIRNVSQGDAIATATPGNLIDFQDSKRINLIFRLQDSKGFPIHLTSSSFSQ